jgi:hypothetical protein
MRSNEIFAGMSGEEAVSFLESMRAAAPEVANLALGAAAEAFRLRPEFLKRQPRQRQAEWMRRALGRTVGAPLAEEVLATYFLEYELEMLVELLDGFGVDHDEGRLAHASPTSPEPKALEKAVAAFRKGADGQKRELLLRAFAAQSSVEWPGLEALLGEKSPAPAAKAAKAAAPKAESKKAPRKPRAKAKTKTKAKKKAKARAKKKKK